RTRPEAGSPSPPPRPRRLSSGPAGVRLLSPRLSLLCSPVSPSPRRPLPGTSSRTGPAQSTSTHAGSLPLRATTCSGSGRQDRARSVLSTTTDGFRRWSTRPRLSLVVGLRTYYSTSTPPHG